MEFVRPDARCSGPTLGIEKRLESVTRSAAGIAQFLAQEGIDAVEVSVGQNDGSSGPRCVHCNACVGFIGTQPVDCYHPRIRTEKDAMLAAMEN